MSYTCSQFRQAIAVCVSPKCVNGMIRIEVHNSILLKGWRRLFGVHSKLCYLTKTIIIHTWTSMKRKHILFSSWMLEKWNAWMNDACYVVRMWVTYSRVLLKDGADCLGRLKQARCCPCGSINIPAIRYVCNKYIQVSPPLVIPEELSVQHRALGLLIIIAKEYATAFFNSKSTSSTRRKIGVLLIMNIKICFSSMCDPRNTNNRSSTVVLILNRKTFLRWCSFSSYLRSVQFRFLFADRLTAFCVTLGNSRLFVDRLLFFRNSGNLYWPGAGVAVRIESKVKRVTTPANFYAPRVLWWWLLPLL